MSVEIEKCLEEIFREKGNMRQGSSMFKILNHAIIDTQVNGDEIMYFSGKYVGSKIMESNRKKGKVNNIPVAIKKAVKSLGIGNVVGIRLKKDEILLEVESCPHLKNRLKRRCNFLQGLLTGMMSVTSGKTYSVKSIKCKRADDSHCVFQLASRNQ